MHSSPTLRSAIQHTFRELGQLNREWLVASQAPGTGVLIFDAVPGDQAGEMEDWEALMQPLHAIEVDSLPDDFTVEACEEGPIGSIIYRYTAQLPDGRALVIEATSPCHLRDGVWREGQPAIVAHIVDVEAPHVPDQLAS